jgi:hypothetical protein
MTDMENEKQTGKIQMFPVPEDNLHRRNKS